MDLSEKPPFQNNLEDIENFSMKKFIEPRIQEILMLSEALNEPPAKGQLFQRLPKHMRRRQMSHNPSRLPNKLKTSIALNQEPPPKRPRRKFRRKPSNIALNFASRSEKKSWLETHVWHAKRFHMVDYTNYVLPDRPTNKGFRANYRACKSHCLIMDESYLSVIQLLGPEKTLFDALRECTKPEYGLTFTAASLTEGTKESKTTMFMVDDEANEVIDNIYFLWKPKEERMHRSLMLWMHPTLESSVSLIFQTLLDLNADNESTWTSGLVTMHIDPPMNRFRLIGPLASSILSDALSIAPNEKSHDWTVKYLKKNWIAQKDMFEKLKNTPPHLFPPNAVLGLLVNDPRFAAPSQKVKSQINEPGERILQWDKLLPFSVLWNPATRDEVSEGFIKDSEVNKAKRGFVVPKISEFENQPAIPIWLIQQPGLENGFGAGWDVIIPKNWGMAFWRAFIMRGARAGGLNDAKRLRIEMEDVSTIIPVDHYGLGKYYYVAQTEDRKAEFFRMPPAKRPNYTKLGVSNPFSCDWRKLELEGQANVLRNLKILHDLHDAVEHDLKFELATFDGYLDALVPIAIRCETTGRITEYARIYLPNALDLTGQFELNEPIHEDFNADNRKTEVQRRRRELNSRRKHLRRYKNTGKLSSDLQGSIEKQAKEFREKSRGYWLPDFKVQNERKIIGYVVQGDFSHRVGCCVAQGYIQYCALFSIIEKLPVRNKILCRNTNSVSYKRCTFSVLTH